MTRFRITCDQCKTVTVTELWDTAKENQIRNVVKSGKVKCPTCHKMMGDKSSVSIVHDDASDKGES